MGPESAPVPCIGMLKACRPSGAVLTNATDRTIVQKINSNRRNASLIVTIRFFRFLLVNGHLVEA